MFQGSVGIFLDVICMKWKNPEFPRAPKKFHSKPSGDDVFSKGKCEQRERNPYGIPLYWLVYRDPYIGSL